MSKAQSLDQLSKHEFKYKHIHLLGKKKPSKIIRGLRKPQKFFSYKPIEKDIIHDWKKTHVFLKSSIKRMKRSYKIGENNFQTGI